MDGGSKLAFAEAAVGKQHSRCMNVKAVGCFVRPNSWTENISILNTANDGYLPRPFDNLLFLVFRNLSEFGLGNHRIASGDRHSIKALILRDIAGCFVNDFPRRPNYVFRRCGFDLDGGRLSRIQNVYSDGKLESVERFVAAHDGGYSGLVRSKGRLGRGGEIRALFHPELLLSERKVVPSGSSSISRSISSFLGGATLPESEESVGKYQTRSNLGPEKLILVVGCAVCLGSLIGLFKVLDKVYLDPRFNVDMAVCGFFLALAMFLFGGWIVFHALGLLSVRHVSNPAATGPLALSCRTKLLCGDSVYRAALTPSARGARGYIYNRVRKTIDRSVYVLIGDPPEQDDGHGPIPFDNSGRVKSNSLSRVGILNGDCGGELIVLQLNNRSTDPTRIGVFDFVVRNFVTEQKVAVNNRIEGLRFSDIVKSDASHNGLSYSWQGRFRCCVIRGTEAFNGDIRTLIQSELILERLQRLRGDLGRSISGLGLFLGLDSQFVSVLGCLANLHQASVGGSAAADIGSRLIQVGGIQRTPLEVSEHGVQGDDSYTQHFKKIPPLLMAPFLWAVGLYLIYRGRRNVNPNIGQFSLYVGVGLWVYGWFIILSP